APARLGLTGLRSYFWVGDDLEPVTATAGVPGLTVTAEARPVRYRWEFGDGTNRTTQHPGRPWTRARDGNVGHLYETKGRYEPSVTVVWAARWRIGRGPWADLGYFSTSGSTDYRVRQMIAVLVRGASRR
ncbi:MAG TPA: PKD domain-containing protein, partial [Actinomycetota bacterium]|nr:PKD domain-containing protein [Actinomycetota bacterium]